LPGNQGVRIAMSTLTFAAARQSPQSSRCRFITGLLVATVVLLQACASLSPDYEIPTVTVSSFRALPSEGALPAFAIGLRVINPNREPLKLEGVAYTVSLEGHEVIKGVANELPVIDAYGEGEFELTAAANLFAGIRLITDLMSKQNGSLDYKLEAKLDIGAFRPAIRVSDSGQIGIR
jgi:LEA14-like dessication related protein